MRSASIIAFIVAAGVLAGAASVNAQSFPFVIPGDDFLATVTDRSVLLGEAIDKGPFVTVRDGHFFSGDRRIRFWGVNLCFGANFPTHAEADLVAPHLAKLGVNAVRFHHMDMQNAPNGIWAPVDSQGVRRLDEEMVDRLDYFLARLHENGIYANLNLHVSRTLTPEEGFPVAEGMPWWAGANKWVVYYDRDVQRELKRYCRDLLTHANPYRGGRRRVDDPGLALVEMMNENYFSKQGYDLYRRLPERFQRSLIGRWNEWLAARYGNQETMEKTWDAAQPKLGAPFFPKASWQSDLGGWELNQPAAGLPHRFGVAFSGEADTWAVRLEPKVLTDQDHHQQLRHGGISTKKGEPLSLSFWVRSDKPRRYRAELSSSAGGEWRSLGLFETLTASAQWQKVQRIILPDETIEGEVGLVMTIGNSKEPIEFAAVTLREGAATAPLPNGQSLQRQTIGIPEAMWPVAAHKDMRRFMVDTEVEWVRELKSFLKDELGVRVPITASQVNYHDTRVNEDVSDFVDLHNYWHHPLFPSGEDWSPERWTVGNDPMEADPARSSWPANSLLMRTGWRVEGKPMTLSEWNYPEPSPYSAGCIPMAAVLASLQDWDGVFFFDYDAFSREEDESPFFRDRADNFFSFNGQPVKLAVFSQCANLFLRGDLAPLASQWTSTPEAPIDGRFGLQSRLAVNSGAEPFASDEFPNTTDFATPDGSLRWRSRPPAAGVLELNTSASRGVWGTIAESSYRVGGLDLQVGSIEPNYGIVLLSSTDGRPLEEAGRMLLLAACRSENQNMGWNEDGNGVGTRWGSGPTKVTGFELIVTLPGGGPLECHALDGRGRRTQAVPVRKSGKASTVTVAPKYETLWFEISRSTEWISACPGDEFPPRGRFAALPGTQRASCSEQSVDTGVPTLPDGTGP